MPQGLAVSRLVNVDVNLAPIAARGFDFNSCLVIGSSSAINVEERLRSYNGIDEVAADFGSTDPEFLAAELFFSQVPQPDELHIGRWAETATPAILIGGILSAAQQVMSNWTAISTGAFTFTVAGVVHNVTGLDFSAQTNLNGVASVISAAVVAYGSVVWDGEKFVFTSTATGNGTTVTFASAPGSGTDISTMLRWTSATSAQIIEGIDAETPLDAVIALDALNTQWYAMTFAADLTSDETLAVAAYIEASSNKHIFGVTTQDTAALSSVDSTSIGYLLKQANYNRTFVQYSGSSPYAVTSLIGRGVTVNFNASNTVITFMWKQEPGVTADFLTSSQANALDANNYNYFAEYKNDTQIVVNGKMASGAYIDEIWGTDWLGNTVQTSVFNLLYTTGTKIPQTDSGNQLLLTAIDQAMAQGVTNGLIAPGVWTTTGFGQLRNGDYLDKGYYLYAPPVATQLQADREARKSVAIQCAVKLAGAIHTVDITINVNR